MDLRGRLSGGVAWVRLLVKDPSELVSREAERASYKRGVTVAAIVGAAASIVTALSMLIFIPEMFGAMPKVMLGMFAVMVAVMLFAYPIIMVIGTFLVTGVGYVMMRLFKGTGRFEEIFGLIAAVALPPYFVASFIISLAAWPLYWLLGINPTDLSQTFLVNILIMLLQSIVPLILLTLILRQASGLGTVKAFLCWAIPAGTLFMFYLGIMGLNILVFQSFSSLGAGVEGFAQLTPQWNSMVYGLGPENATLNLVVYSKGGSAILDTESLKVANNGLDCSVGQVRSFSGFDFAGIIDEKQEMTYTESVPGFLIMDVAGPGCGGAPGQTYNYTIAMKVKKGQKTLPNTGTITGKYTSQE